MVVFKMVIAAGLLILGGILVMDQQLNISQFVAAELIILYVLSSVEKLIMNLSELYDVLTALEKIGQVVDLELEQHKGSASITNTGKGMQIDIQGLRRYPEMERNILDNINLQITPGEKVCITGQNEVEKAP